MAIRWVAEAWDSVQEETIRKCFTKSGITGYGFSVVHRLYEVEDPFDDVVAQEELHELLDRISPSDTNCPVEEYIDGEDDVPIYLHAVNNNWEDHFFLPTLVPHKQSRTHLSKRILMTKKDSLTSNHLHQKSHGFKMQYPH